MLGIKQDEFQNLTSIFSQILWMRTISVNLTSGLEPNWSGWKNGWDTKVVERTAAPGTSHHWPGYITRNSCSLKKNNNFKRGIWKLEHLTWKLEIKQQWLSIFPGDINMYGDISGFLHCSSSFSPPTQRNWNRNATQWSGHKSTIPKDFCSNKHETQFDQRKSEADMKCILWY